MTDQALHTEVPITADWLISLFRLKEGEGVLLTLLMTRAHRALLLGMAALLLASLLVPIVVLAGNDLAAGDTAIVSNPSGANIRSGASTSAAIIAEIPAGSPVYVADHPVFVDNGSWVWVISASGEGFVSTSLLQKVSSGSSASEPETAATEVTGESASGLITLDTLVVVDYNIELPTEGLSVRSQPDPEAPILGRAVVGSQLEVLGERVAFDENVSFVPVRFNGFIGYVHSDFVELASENIVPAPEEDAVIEDEIVDEPIVEETATEELPSTDAQEPETPADVPGDQAPLAPESEVTEEATTEEIVPEETVPADDQGDIEGEAVTPEVETEPAPPVASTSPASDLDSFIGSATVTGTSSGLLCRTEPGADAPVLMTLAEGTRVMVFAEAVNGYLGIDCGGLQGYADVNYLWSGGAGDSDINAAKMTVVVTGTGNGLNCRAGAGTNYGIITTLFDGATMVTRGKSENGWTPVTCAGTNGFVSTTWIESKAGTSTPGGTTNPGGSTGVTGSAIVDAGGTGLYCRTGAGTSYSIITVLGHGSSVTVRGAAQGSWIPVTCAGAEGFAHADFLKVSPGTTTPEKPEQPGTSTPSGSVTVANTGGMALNCRSGAGTSFGVITTLALGQTVQTRSGSVNGWTAVICGNANGFVSSDFVTGGGSTGTPSEPSTPAPTPTPPTTPAPVAGMENGDHGKVTTSLNLRYEPNLSSGVALAAPAGIVVLITGNVTGEFYPVNYDGLVGYMHKDYLVKTDDALSKRGGSGNEGTPKPPTTPTPPETSTPTGSAMVTYAMRYLGYPYVWATHGPASFDCSGFTYWIVLNVMGKNIGAGTWTQVAAGTPVSRANLQPGDLVFFQNTYQPGLSHVGMYIGNSQFIHAENETTGVVISSLDSTYYSTRWYSAVRI